MIFLRYSGAREPENHLSDMSGSDLRIQIGLMPTAFFGQPGVPIPPPFLQFPFAHDRGQEGHLAFGFRNATHAKIGDRGMRSGKFIDLKQGIRRRLRFALTKWRRVVAGNILNFPPRT